MTTTIFFVRHGAHDRLDHVLCGRMAGVSLGASGRDQADRAARRLSGESLAALYVSPLERARETAAPIGAASGLPPVVTDALNEIDVGEWTGASFAALDAHPGWKPWNTARSQHRAPGGESMLEVQARVARWMTDMVAQHPEARIGAVCHADVIKAALCHALGLPLDHHHRLEIGPGSVSVIVGGPWGFKAHSVNEAPR